MKIAIDTLDLSFQGPECLIAETVHDYAEILRAGGSIAPVEVCSDGQTHWLVDGFHRMAAARTVGVTTLDANIFAGTVTEMEARFREALAMILHDLREPPG